MNIKITQATIADIDTLMEWRMEVLHSVFSIPKEGGQEDFRKATRSGSRVRIKKLSLISPHKGKNKGKGQLRGRENAENTSIFGDFG